MCLEDDWEEPRGEDHDGRGVGEIKAVLSGGGGAPQSFSEPGNSLVRVCQRSIFLSLFLRQSNQCLSRSPFALMPRDTPPGRTASVSHRPNERER